MMYETEIPATDPDCVDYQRSLGIDSPDSPTSTPAERIGCFNARGCRTARSSAASGRTAGSGRAACPDTGCASGSCSHANTEDRARKYYDANGYHRASTD